MGLLTTQNYYKITNDSEMHRGFKYQDGLNILDEPFGESNGFHFVSLEDVPRYYSYGFNLREVQIPDGATVRTGNDLQSFRSDMIFFGIKYSLRDPETYRTLGLDISKNMYLFNECCTQGKYELLHHWNNLSYVRPEISLPRLVSHATLHNHIYVLDWLRRFAENVGTQFPFCESAVKTVVSQNKTEMISWWAKNFDKPCNQILQSSFDGQKIEVM
jgi:hypothetical protein